MTRYGKDALIRRDGRPYGEPRQHRVSQGRGLVRIELGRHTCWLYGAGIRGVLEAVGCRRLWDRDRDCWSCPFGDAPAIARYVQNVQRRAVEVEELPRPPTRRPAAHHPITSEEET